MDSDSANITAVIGVIGAILTVLIKLFDVIGSWKKSKESERRTEKEIDHAIKDVEFINGWLEAIGHSSSGNELESRRNVALSHLDSLMLTYQSHPRDEKKISTLSKKKKSNVWFYVISVFLGLGVLGSFMDDDDNLSISYFLENFDEDLIIGFGFIFLVWVYFLINSSFFSKHRNSS